MMKKENKKITSSFVENEILDHVSTNPHIKSLSDWINTRYPKEFMNIEKEKKELDRLQEEAKLCKQRIKSLENITETLGISDVAYEWIKEEGVKRTEEKTVEGVLKFFNNEFDINLSQRQFKILLEKVKKQNKEEELK